MFSHIYGKLAHFFMTAETYKQKETFNLKEKRNQIL